MKVALKGSYVEFVFFMGVTEHYPTWFDEEINDNIYMDEARYTFWVPKEERAVDYYEKQLIEDYTVFLRKANGDIHVTDYDTFNKLYMMFCHNAFTNSGVAALTVDCIEYVEVKGGVLDKRYPEWFYEYFTEAVNFPNNEETVLIQQDGNITVKAHSVFLRNKFGEIKELLYEDFIKYYDPQPAVGIWSVVNFHKYYGKH